MFAFFFFCILVSTTNKGSKKKKKKKKKMGHRESKLGKRVRSSYLGTLVLGKRLITAAKMGFPETVDKLLNDGAPINYQDQVFSAA